jgi:hypothetical protein
MRGKKRRPSRRGFRPDSGESKVKDIVIEEPPIIPPHRARPAGRDRGLHPLRGQIRGCDRGASWLLCVRHRGFHSHVTYCVQRLRASKRDLLMSSCFTAHVALWPNSPKCCRVERVSSARQVQTSIFSAISIASSISTPRYRTVLSILVWPSSR